jgi:hypothetical protein
MLTDILLGASEIVSNALQTYETITTFIAITRQHCQYSQIFT